MTIPPECEAQILRYFHVEKWPPTTIARQLNINRGTVKRVLAQAGLTAEAESAELRNEAGAPVAGLVVRAMKPVVERR